MPAFAYALPFVVLIVFATFAIARRAALWRALSEGEQASEPTRGFAFTLAGVSMGLLTLIVLDPSRTLPPLEAAITFSGISFFCYLTVAFIQSYKAWVLLELLSDCLMSVGSICMVLALWGIVTASGVGARHFIVALALVAWFADWIVRMVLEWKVLSVDSTPADDREGRSHSFAASWPPSRAFDYVRCPKHGIWFRKGGQCPQCHPGPESRAAAAQGSGIDSPNAP